LINYDDILKAEKEHTKNWVAKRFTEDDKKFNAMFPNRIYKKASRFYILKRNVQEYFKHLWKAFKGHNCYDDWGC
jgi:hypothetical protein